VLISDEHEYTNYAGQPLHNVVRAKGSMSLAEVDLQDGSPARLTIDGAFPLNTLVVFAQKKPATFQIAPPSMRSTMDKRIPTKE
jgi:hypothetical protein